MPPTDGGEWLLDWLFDAGPIGTDGFGARGLNWIELDAWRSATRTLADANDLRALRRLSAIYAAALRESSVPEHGGYWRADEVIQAEIRRSDQVGAGLAAIFSGMAQRGGDGA